MSENGERWEGDSLNGKPYGYGCIYNSENQLVYKGFMYNGKKVCYGTEFFGDIGIVEYQGDYYEDKKNLVMANCIIRRMNWFIKENGISINQSMLQNL